MQLNDKFIYFENLSLNFITKKPAGAALEWPKF